MIPKKIHYIWLGKGKLNNTSLICINSWKRILPDYEIKLWNEENIDLKELTKKNRFLKECIKRKLWAFASDYLRLYILSEEGGIYLDTDVEVLRSFSEFLDEEFFIGLEANGYVGTGVIGAEPNSPAVKRLLKFYDDEIWNVDYYNNPIIFKNLFDNDNSFFINCKILPEECFSPYNPAYPKQGLVENENTFCIHWYNYSWGMSRKGYVFLNTKHCKNPIIKFFEIIKKNIGYYRRRKLFK